MNVSLLTSSSASKPANCVNNWCSGLRHTLAKTFRRPKYKKISSQRYQTTADTVDLACRLKTFLSTKSLSPLEGQTVVLKGKYFNNISVSNSMITLVSSFIITSGI